MSVMAGLDIHICCRFKRCPLIQLMVLPGERDVGDGRARDHGGRAAHVRGRCSHLQDACRSPGLLRRVAGKGIIPRSTVGDI
eukprot:2953312-Rhodomonas_salina.1